VIDFVGRRIFQKYPFLVENKAGLRGKAMR